MKTHGIVVADDPVYLSWLQSAVGKAVEFSWVRPLDAEDLLERVANLGEIDIALFEFDGGSSPQRATMVERLLERYPEVPVVGLGAEGRPEIVLAAMRAGARDFFVLRRDDENLSVLLSKVLRRTVVSAPRSTGQGKLYTTFAAQPYDGIAFFAEHLALGFAGGAVSDERILLMDMACPPGSASVFLNLNQSYSVLDAVNDVYRCDQTLVDTAFSRHESGIYVLSLPEDLVGRPQFEVDDFLKLVEVLRGLFTVIVLSLDGSLPLDALTTLIGQSDRALMLSDQSILRSRHSKHLLRALRLKDCALDRTVVVVDRFRRRIGLDPENLARLLDLPMFATLSGQSATRIQAMNSGESLYSLAPKDPYCLDVGAVVKALKTGAETAAAPASGLIGKLFG
ncbi:hypothetical protein RM530_05220 [Algiphilus sp. W345]|uniref:Response regulatory domain-containing protein n=1 Tax=Banduia mediterranea TaxID=3075609 RepID=A0ABU2WFV9_9GAMM|nr:hypothetical protein [Algiphilus sp. W345]MDT0496763.1 hypothetical protein [Algiphilus sp. W345]